ncbi:hypothetical protein HPB52_002118 [Rhipicephalus sanguineus]|uniref:Endonuclease/exonuclease/phosphatase domain-containing protein n=1 Tax=Rhipicephalus sanguineus TaxID=34632 RepID=A0A9D4QCX7_RHISA|nr:hypothetical protein HPB52_002118 [Rhipicephalus sanguineus]
MQNRPYLGGEPVLDQPLVRASAACLAKPNAERKPIGGRAVSARRVLATLERSSPKMSQAAEKTIETPSDQLGDADTVHMDATEIRNAEATWRYDASSGRTIERESVWITRGRKGKKDAGETTTPEGKPHKEETSTQQPQPQRRKPMLPPLPFDDYKVVYRPQAGLELAKWNNIAIMHAIGRASGLSQQDFGEKVCVQVQRLENLIIASTAEWEDAKKLESITSIQLGGTFFTIKGNTRTPDDVSRGVISGLLPGTSEEELKSGLHAQARYTILHARMLGQSSAAVIFFQGPHVPYYVRFHSLDFRCRPYRKSVQYCKTCGNTGHRQDVCPRPQPDFCSKCGKTNQPSDHVCIPTCKLCGEGHETASKDCKKRLKPNPPPFHIRLQRMERLKARDCRKSPGDEDFPELGSQTTNLRSSAGSTTTRVTFILTGSGHEQMAEVPLAQFHLPASARGDQNRLKMAVPNHRTTNTLSTLRIWQWNCRSYRPRYASLQEFVKQDPPDLIALQETNTENVRLLGYNAHVQTKRTAILTKKNLTVQELEPVNTPIEHTVIEVIPERKSHKSLIVASVYSPPKDQLPDFDLLVRELKKRADGHQVVIMGDFNAPHTAWGYHTTTKKGARVHDTAQQHRLTLWNDPLQTTRVGNSVSRDTNPDLTFTLNVRSAEWDRLPETLGSDHHIIQLTVAHTRKPARIGTAQITEEFS